MCCILKGVPRISLGSRSEQDVVNGTKRKEVVLQMCDDQNTEEIGNGFSLVRLRGMQSVSVYHFRMLSEFFLICLFLLWFARIKFVWLQWNHKR
jgi:hypothetical protein